MSDPHHRSSPSIGLPESTRPRLRGAHVPLGARLHAPGETGALEETHPIPRRRHGLAWAGAAVAAAFWLAETVLDSWVFDKGTFVENLLPSDLHEAWMRTLAASLLMAFGIAADVVSTRRHRAVERERSLRRELDDAVAHLLADFIPICAGCKSVRDEDRWVRIEEYVTDHTGSHFSHGLCPKCLKAAEAEFEG